MLFGDAMACGSFRMTRRRWIYVDGVAHEVGAEHTPEPRGRDWRIMPDIQPYRSMIDGSIIPSRSRHREHLRAHNCVEVGNDSSLTRPRQPIQSPPGLKKTLIEVANAKLRRI